MPEVKEVYDMVTQKAGPEPGALQRQFRKQDRNARTKKLGALAVAAAIAAILALVLVNRPADDATKVVDGPTPTSAIGPNGAAEPQIVRMSGSKSPFPGLPPDAQALDLSADGSTVAFATIEDDTWQIAVAEVADVASTTTVLTDGSRFASFLPSLSPDGTQIAFQQRSPSGNDDVYVIGTDGRGLAVMAEGPDDESNPDWSPDGTQIVFERGRQSPADVDAGSTDSEIWTVNVASGLEQRLTHDSLNDIEPAWSPDGQRIAYFHMGQLWTIGSDGRDAQMIVDESNGAWAPAWSPDGTEIAYLVYDPADRATFPAEGAENAVGDAPLLRVTIIDVATGNRTPLDVRVVTDWNAVNWIPSGEGLLVNAWEPR
jgi:dipeptidyl aminopeptidase/acylaminoacyl peptidase